MLATLLPLAYVCMWCNESYLCSLNHHWRWVL